MNVIEYGSPDAPVILMLHGGGLSWWNYRKEAELLKDRFHVILPILDGHSGSDRHFHSIPRCAEELRTYLSQQSHTPLVLCGLSLGAQIALEMLHQDPNLCPYAVLESPSLIPSPMIRKLIPSSVSMSYGFIKKPWFARLQFASLKMDPEYFEEYYRDSVGITKDDLIFMLKANAAYTLPSGISAYRGKLSIHAGAKEPKNMLRSARLLQQACPGSRLAIHEGYAHGQYALNHPDEYVRDLIAFVSD